MWSITLTGVDISFRREIMEAGNPNTFTHRVVSNDNLKSWIITQAQYPEMPCMPFGHCQCISYESFEDANDDLGFIKNGHNEFLDVGITILAFFFLFAKVGFKCSFYNSSGRKLKNVSLLGEVVENLALYGFNRTFRYYTESCLGAEIQLKLSTSLNVMRFLGIGYFFMIFIILCSVKESDCKLTSKWFMYGMIISGFIGCGYSVYVMAQPGLRFGFWEVKLIVSIISMLFVNDMCNQKVKRVQQQSTTHPVERV